MYANAIPDARRKEILARLRSAETEHSVRIVYACESGSRAWGFASPDSDYDVRFLYVHDNDWYLSFDIERRRDVIEYPIVDEIDRSGWDVRKALYLFTRTNRALLEWLSSPIKYIESGGFAESLRQLAPEFVNSTALCYHYCHMARGNAREYLFNPVRADTNGFTGLEEHYSFLSSRYYRHLVMFLSKKYLLLTRRIGLPA